MRKTLKIMNLGERVRQLREEKGWSQTELAAQLPGVYQQSIDQLERGQVRRPRFLPELAQALGTHVQWLLTGEGRKETDQNQMGEIDSHLLQDVFIAVEYVLGQRRKKTVLKDKVKLICALYEIMRHEENRTTDKLKQAANNIVGYDQFIKNSKKSSV